MKLKTLGKTTWDKIKVGEFFAVKGCWSIHEKTSYFTSRCIASDNRWFEELEETEYALTKDGVFRVESDWINNTLESLDDIYKLPLSVQRLWRTD